MNVTTAAEARQLLNRRAAQPRNELPTVRLEGTTATIRLFDPIDSWGEWWGLSAKELAAVVDDLPSNIEEIRLLINSPGGEVFEGLAIVNVLRSHSARIVAVVQGLAASAASFIAASADETIMAPNSQLMIHDAWGICIGNADDMLTMGATLDQISGNLADIYARKAGGDADEWRDKMRAETWFTAEEAVDVGLADKIEDGPDEGEPSNRLDGGQPQVAATDHDDRQSVDVSSHDSDELELLNL